MQTHIDTRTVVREGEEFVASRFSVDLSLEHTCIGEAVRIVFTEMMRAGCGTLSRVAFQDTLHTLGAQMGVIGSGSVFTFHFEARNDVLKKALPLYKTFITSPTFETKELTRVKEYLKNTLALAHEDAKGRAHDAFVNSAVSVRDWRFSYEIDEYLQALQKVTRADLLRLHASIFTEKWKHTCGGTTESCTLVTKTLAGCGVKSTHPTTNVTTEVSVLTHTTISLIDIPAKQNIEFSIGGTLPITFDHPDTPALTLGINILGMYGGFTGRLMSTVREKEGLTYSIYCRLEDVSRYDEGYWRIMTFFNTADTLRGIESTLREVRTLVHNGITPDELTRFKTIMRTRRILEQDSLLRVLGSTHARHTGDISDEQYTAYIAHIDTLTVDTVNDALMRHLGGKSLIISGAGPVSALKSEILKTFENTLI